jgi:ABC-type polysaccharide/polyol phosphate export permease
MLEGKAPEAVLFVMRWNPMNQFVVAFRSMLYDGSWPSKTGFAVVSIAAAISLTGGHFIFKKLNKRVAEEI